MGLPLAEARESRPRHRPLVPRRDLSPVPRPKQPGQREVRHARRGHAAPLAAISRTLAPAGGPRADLRGRVLRQGGGVRTASVLFRPRAGRLLVHPALLGSHPASRTLPAVRPVGPWTVHDGAGPPAARRGQSPPRQRGSGVAPLAEHRGSTRIALLAVMPAAPQAPATAPRSRAAGPPRSRAMVHRLLPAQPPDP